MLAFGGYFILSDARPSRTRFPYAHVDVGQDDSGGVSATIQTNYCGGALTVSEDDVDGSDPGPITITSPLGLVILQRATLATRDIPEVQIALAGFSPEAVDGINRCTTDAELQKFILWSCT